MNKKTGYFVKINFKSFKRCSNQKFNILTGEKLSNKYLLCGGVFNRDGGTIIFRAENEEQAFEIASKNPYIDCDSYNYEILENNYISLVS